MIIETERGTIKSDNEEMLLTDGMSYGVEYILGADRDISEFTEITREEYASSVSTSSVSGADTFSNTLTLGEGTAEVM